MKQTKPYLLKIFENNPLPQTQEELRQGLAKMGLDLNKTTIYRQLEKLEKENLIKPVSLGDRQTRYELNLHNHHHHLVCTNCKKVEDIFVHNDVKHVEDKIRKDKNFQIQNHILEFFGLCAQCQ